MHPGDEAAQPPHLQQRRCMTPLPGRMWRTGSGPLDPSSGPRPRRIDVLLPSSLAQLPPPTPPPPPAAVNAFMRRQGTWEDRQQQQQLQCWEAPATAEAPRAWQWLLRGGGALRRPQTAGAATVLSRSDPRRPDLQETGGTGRTEILSLLSPSLQQPKQQQPSVSAPKLQPQEPQSADVLLECHQQKLDSAGARSTAGSGDTDTDTDTDGTDTTDASSDDVPGGCVGVDDRDDVAKDKRRQLVVVDGPAPTASDQTPKPAQMPPRPNTTPPRLARPPCSDQSHQQQQQQQQKQQHQQQQQQQKQQPQQKEKQKPQQPPPKRVRVRRRVPALIPSQFPGVPAVLNFAAEGELLETAPPSQRQRSASVKLWRLGSATPSVVRRLVARSGFRFLAKPGLGDEFDSIESDEWLGYFGKHLKPNEFGLIQPHQKVNHFPGSFALGRKDRLWQGLRRMLTAHGDVFDIAPATYCLPEDLHRLREDWDAAAAAAAASDSSSRSSASSSSASTASQDDRPQAPLWILKPPASARGQGIRLISRWPQVPRRRAAVVQAYISRPYLINGSKFDLRIYVFVTSFDPLRAYIHELGLVRFASCPYDEADPGNRFAHLTNYSVNKHSQGYRLSQQDGQGHKWSLQALWSHLRSRGHSPEAVWDAVKEVATKALLSAESHIAGQVRLLCQRPQCVHELFGFDVLLDENLRPWLLEVNVSPSLNTDSPVDLRVKDAVLTDALRLAGFRSRRCSGGGSGGGADDIDWTSSPAAASLLAEDEVAKRDFHADPRRWRHRLARLLDAPLTPWDVRCLAVSADELARRGGYQRLMPAPGDRGIRWLGCLDRGPSYANLLLHAFASRYQKRLQQRDWAAGLELLAGLCRQGVHLQLGATATGDGRDGSSDGSNINSNDSTSSSGGGGSGGQSGGRAAKLSRQLWCPPVGLR